jgi:hypothetical protein
MGEPSIQEVVEDSIAKTAKNEMHESKSKINANVINPMYTIASVNFNHFSNKNLFLTF